MNYLTTAQIAESWGISVRRIAILCAEGRVSGAMRAGKSWLIPAGTPKPEDGRRKSAKRSEEGRYNFPHISFAVNRNFSADEMTDDEKRLLDASMRYEAGDWAEGAEICEELLRTAKERYIRIGALYYSYYDYVLTHRFEKARQTQLLFYQECAEMEDRKEELKFLMQEVESYSDNSSWLIDNFNFDAEQHYSGGALAFIDYLCVLRDVALLGLGRSDGNIHIHEIHCLQLERQGYIDAPIVVHYFLSLMYLAYKNTRMERFHLRRSIDMAIENGRYCTLAFAPSYLSDHFFEVFQEYPEDVRKRVTSLIEQTFSARMEYLHSESKEPLISRLSSEDVRYITYCIRGYDNARIAEAEGVSEITVKRRLAALCTKIGTRGKKGLAREYERIVFGFKKDEFKNLPD